MNSISLRRFCGTTYSCGNAESCVNGAEHFFYRKRGHCVGRDCAEPRRRSLKFSRIGVNVAVFSLCFGLLIIAELAFATGEPASSAAVESGLQGAIGGVKSAGKSDAKFFVTLPPSQFPVSATPQQIEEARLANDSRPENQDPEGHWGGVTEGCVLSVRFKQENFRADEPIMAVVLIRNATDRKVIYRDFVGMGEDSPLCQFDILDEQQQLVPRLNPKAPGNITDGPHLPRLLSPGTQCRYEVRLDAKFKLLQPGKYSVRARRWVHNLDRDGYSELRSGAAAFLIVKPATGSADPTARVAADGPAAH